ncbi:MAG: FKBP-type peptidyl-prolyl cis-trans isomerase N-terminal domain-containing protein, partial [Lutibacter sp.]|nr:FKBP-type peptidyl-prolyl cis-trans isomerase N-terminal domain-containing protein [Lutibacter sp.]
MKVIKILMAGSLVLSMAACNNTGLTKNTLDTAVDSASYALGMDMGLKIKANFEDMNTALFARGLNNAIDSTDFLIENEEIPMILQAFFQQRQEEKMAEEQAKALQKAEA